jgi:hypothetical protein
MISLPIIKNKPITRLLKASMFQFKCLYKYLERSYGIWQVLVVLSADQTLPSIEDEDENGD